MAVSKEQIKHIAYLARLELSEEEIVKFEKEFNNILNYISKINECDTNGIVFEHNLQDNTKEVFAEDTIKSSTLSKEKIARNATDGRYKNGYIRTSKIISKE